MNIVPIDETVHLARLDGSDVVYLASRVAILSTQPPVYAMSCSIPQARLTDEHRRSVVAALTGCADELRYAAWH